MDISQARTLLRLVGNRINVHFSQALPGGIGQKTKLEVMAPGAIAVLKEDTAMISLLSKPDKKAWPQAIEFEEPNGFIASQ